MTTTIHNEPYDETWGKIEDNSLDLVIADPPYNVNYKYSTYKDNLSENDYFFNQCHLFTLFYRKLKEGGSFLYLNYPEFCADIWASQKNTSYKRHEWITWIYNTHTGGSPLRKASRVWIWFSKGEPYFDKTYLSGEYKNPNDKRVKKLIEAGRKPDGYDWIEMQQVKNVSEEKTEHPCQLPIEMLRKLIGATSPKNGLVYDPYCGSGSAAVACEIEERNFIGSEIDPKYYEIALNQVKKYKSEKEIF